MRKVIIESPYGSTDPAVVERNRRYLRAAMRDCILRGEAPYASHAMYTQPGVLDDNIPEERKLGIEAGFVWRSAADATVVYVDLGVSRGMEYGITAAQDLDDSLRKLISNPNPRTMHPIEYRLLGPDWDREAPDSEFSAYASRWWSA